jgi:hypothetical protein
VAHAASVESVDRAARTVVLGMRGTSLPACKVGRSVRHFRDIRAGDEVKARIKAVLTVYVAPIAGLSADARVLAADPSYRLLTVQYANGETETFKLGLHTRMTDIEAGDSVTIRPVEVVKLRVRRHSSREAGSRSSQSAASGS